jgi:3-oxoacyl-[acyl-carrier-protein] synthase-1
MIEAASHDIHIFDYLCAHGTATPFNDESESIAIQRAGLDQVPMNSLKGYWGHTLGAAGVLESIATVRSLQGNFLLNTLGYETHGVSNPLNIITGYREQSLQNAMKTASGFGGCNAAIAFSKLS